MRDALIAELEEQLRHQGLIMIKREERLSELERRLGLNSANSGKPPAFPKRGDGPRKKAGGQRGHAGTTLRRTETPDHCEHCYPEVCAHCGTAFTDPLSVGQEIRQVHDFPEPSPLIVTDHVAHIRACPTCQGTTRAAFPDDIKATVQCGPTPSGLAVYLNTCQLVPTRRLVETFRDLFGVQMYQGTLINMVSRCADTCQGFAETVRRAVAQAPVKHVDETGIRVEGKLHWPHVACTTLPTFFRIGTGRGDVMRDAAGIAVHATSGSRAIRFRGCRKRSVSRTF
ncbi:MAG: transposase [Roseovarius sp.]|nr:transposase [Roseovarius sp.]